jgi:hypothetical protein
MRDAEFELVDIKDFNLPLLDEPLPPSQGQYSQPHTKAWAAKIGSFDGYVFVTPEYNYGIAGALKNAIDFLFAEWYNKAAGFVGYGSAGGTRAVEHLRLVMAEVQVATVHNQVALSLFTDFENCTVFGHLSRKGSPPDVRPGDRLGRGAEDAAGQSWSSPMTAVSLLSIAFSVSVSKRSSIALWSRVSCSLGNPKGRCISWRWI